jgi:hypothetical protein
VSTVTRQVERPRGPGLGKDALDRDWGAAAVAQRNEGTGICPYCTTRGGARQYPEVNQVLSYFAGVTRRWRVCPRAPPGQLAADCLSTMSLMWKTQGGGFGRHRLAAAFALAAKVGPFLAVTVIREDAHADNAPAGSCLSSSLPPF